MDMKSIINNTEDIYMTDTSMSVLLDYERVLDDADMYAFKNWINGELVSGPNIEKYWVTCTFMYPYKMIPDPKAAARLLDYNCKVTYEQDEVSYPKKLESPDDFEPGTKKPKMVKKRVWLVTIQIPKELLTDVEQGFMELEGQQIEMDEVDTAYEADIEEEGALEGDAEDEIQDELDF